MAFLYLDARLRRVNISVFSTAVLAGLAREGIHLHPVNGSATKGGVA